ncbi:MAG TPA: MFS transporter [Thermoanaerobaculia bacterium]|jgi:NNP family nitrate/nitrite transporter-like MFS transporter|nr:MFS transporter [Thermoanaerobaculia bacterium]
MSAVREPKRDPAVRQLALATLAFAVCFAAWGLIGALAPRFREALSLSGTATGLLIATPVLLGSLARLPMGVLGDRFGGRAVLAALMTTVAGACLLVPLAGSYRQVLGAGFLLGLAGSSFSVGVGFVSRWTPREKQGLALGIYGAGNIGQSIAVFFAPVLAASVGVGGVFRWTAVLVALYAVVWLATARNPPGARPASGLAALRGVMRERLAWVLSLFYFLTFGGFVAFAIYLPILLRDDFGLRPADAGLRAAGFVVLATAARPLGGWLADRLGGARVLAGVFLGVVPFALLLAWQSMVPFTVGALGCAAMLGLGNGAVFKLVGERFADRAGTVAGLVGAMGGLGGFFPPLLLGVFRDRMGAVWPGFLLLALTSLALWQLDRRTFLAAETARALALPPALVRARDRVRAGAIATFWTGVLVASIVVGSRNLQNFDAALVVYTFAVIFATWGVVYHYAVWIQKPPTRIYWRQGWRLVGRQGFLRNVGFLLATAWTHVFAQTFIARRSRTRWWMHQLIFWGCLLAAAITFPLVFGWIHFTSAPGDPSSYLLHVFGFSVMTFRLETPLAWLIFHGLDVSAVLVLAGIALALGRRMRDRGALAVQDFARDFFPLILLFAISVTGLALTVSTWWLRGSFYAFLAILHAVTVIAALLYLPFGKFFHVFQRPAQLGVKLYQREGERGEGAFCVRCGQRFASRMHIDDLGRGLRELGFDYAMDGPAKSWQELCPPCKRASLAAAQLRLRGAASTSTGMTAAAMETFDG